MKLSAEQFAELAQSFQKDNGDSADACGQERRRGSRLELRARCKIMPVVGGKRTSAVEVDVCDFSARGMAFPYAKPMNCGDQFVTELPRQGGGKVQLLCSVANVQQLSPESYRIGAEFICSVQPDRDGSPDVVGQLREVQRIRQSLLG